MEENRYTDLDKIFKDRLNKPSQEDALWNLPADGVFDAAIGQVNEERRKRTALLWILGLLLLVISIGAFVFTAQKVENLEKALAESQRQLKESEGTVTEFKKNGEKAINTKDSEAALKNENVASVQNDIRDGRNGFATDVVKIERQTSNPTYVDTAVEMKSTEAFNSIRTENLASSLDRGVHSSLLALPQLLLPLEDDSQVQISIPQLGSKKIKDQRITWYLGATSNWTTLEMKGIEESTARLTEYDQRYLGYSIRAGLVQELPGRWSIDYRLSYQNFNNLSAYKDDLIYDEGLETIDGNGNTTYSMDINILSPMINTTKGLEFQVDAFSIGDNDVFENITKISEEYDWWTLAIIPKFDLIQLDKWSLNAGLGVQSNYLLKMQEDMDVKLYYRSEMMKNEVIQNDPSDHVNPWSFSALGELTLSHELNERASLSLTAGMQNSMTPINIPSKGAAPRTYVNDAQLGINFNFKI